MLYAKWLHLEGSPSLLLSLGLFLGGPQSIFSGLCVHFHSHVLQQAEFWHRIRP